MILGKKSNNNHEIKSIKNLQNLPKVVFSIVIANVTVFESLHKNMTLISVINAGQEKINQYL